MLNKKDFQIKSWMTIKYGLQGKLLYKNQLLYYTSRDESFNNNKIILKEKMNIVVEDIVNSCKTEKSLFCELNYSQKYTFLL